MMPANIVNLTPTDNWWQVPLRFRTRAACRTSLAACLLAAGLCVQSPHAVAQGTNQTGAPQQTPETTRPRIGDGTTALLHMQVSGSDAAPALPMLGVTANFSWKRYLESFTQPIPESFRRAIHRNDGK